MHLFYQPEIQNGMLHLNEEESRHCAVVLRMEVNDEIYVTDGMGLMHQARIVTIHKKKVEFAVTDSKQLVSKDFRSHIAICPTKQMERMEWFVEKACEMGVDEITFIRSKNSERTVLKLDRLEKKAVSALKQSKGAWKTKLNPLCTLSEWLSEIRAENKLIAAIDTNAEFLGDAIAPRSNTCILIGPEGDFTHEEIGVAKNQGFAPVSMGKKILRTETAGVAAAFAVNMTNSY